MSETVGPHRVALFGEEIPEQGGAGGKVRVPEGRAGPDGHPAWQGYRRRPGRSDPPSRRPERPARRGGKTPPPAPAG